MRFIHNETTFTFLGAKLSIFGSLRSGKLASEPLKCKVKYTNRSKYLQKQSGVTQMQVFTELPNICMRVYNLLQSSILFLLNEIIIYYHSELLYLNYKRASLTIFFFFRFFRPYFLEYFLWSHIRAVTALLQSNDLNST